MFANQRRGSAGLGSITGVALVIAGWLVTTSLFVKVYKEGGLDSMTKSRTCQVVCAGASKIKG